MTYSTECAICGKLFSPGHHDAILPDAIICPECEKQHYDGKRKEEDKELLIRFAVATSQHPFTDNRDVLFNYARHAFDFAEVMLREYRRRTDSK